MRLLDTKTCQFVEKTDIKNVEYAILSHTWDCRGEQTFQDLKRIQVRYSLEASHHSVADPDNARGDAILHPRSIWDDPDLSPKIRDACAVARASGFDLIWIDSCCIDKTSSAELSEAINSMFTWYAMSEVCFAYLIDVPHRGDHRAKGSRFRRSVWFTRGWTLQELIAPFEVIILSQDWNTIGSKRELVDLIEEITNISADALLHEVPLDRYSVAQRLSWASKRETTRVEDHAYSLLGMFDIHMPTLYGEGERAFRRLQEAIIQRIPDQTLFAWRSIHSLRELHLDPLLAPSDHQFLCTRKDRGRSILAPSPLEFVGVTSVVAVPHEAVYRRLQLWQLPVPEYAFTPHGIRTRLPVVPLSLALPPDATHCAHENPLSEWYLAVLGCESDDYPGHLLGKVCNIPSSDTGIHFLYSGSVAVFGPQAQSHSDNFQADLFPLSRVALERCRSQMELKVVYIPHPNREYGDQMLAEKAGKPIKTIHLVLPRIIPYRPFVHEYTAKLRGPDGDAFPTVHWLELSHFSARHTITIEYRHTLNEEGTHLTISGKVTVSRPAYIFAPVYMYEIYVRPSSIVWEDRSPWHERLLKSHVVEVAVCSPKFRIKLGMKLVRRAYYSPVVEVLM